MKTKFKIGLYKSNKNNYYAIEYNEIAFKKIENMINILMFHIIVVSSIQSYLTVKFYLLLLYFILIFLIMYIQVDMINNLILFLNLYIKIHSLYFDIFTSFSFLQFT